MASRRIPFATSVMYGTDAGERTDPDTTTTYVLSGVLTATITSIMGPLSIGTAQNET